MQLSLALARASDPQTSHRAAERSSEFRARHIALILDALKAYGPMTAKEIAVYCPRLDSVKIARRGKEMERDGLVIIGPDVRNGSRVWRAR